MLKKLLVAILALTGLAAVLFIALFAMWRHAGDGVTMRSDRPLPRTAATKQLGFPLPETAHNIYFLEFVGGLQDLESYVRFDVASNELDSSVDALLADNNKTYKRSLEYPRQALTESTLNAPQKEFLPMPWWTPSAATTGYYRGSIDAYALQILVDTDNSRVYIYQND